MLQFIPIILIHFFSVSNSSIITQSNIHETIIAKSESVPFEYARNVLRVPLTGSFEKPILEISKKRVRMYSKNNVKEYPNLMDSELKNYYSSKELKIYEELFSIVSNEKNNLLEVFLNSRDNGESCVYTLKFKGNASLFLGSNNIVKNKDILSCFKEKMKSIKTIKYGEITVYSGDVSDDSKECDKKLIWLNKKKK